MILSSLLELRQLKDKASVFLDFLMPTEGQSFESTTEQSRSEDKRDSNDHGHGFLCSPGRMLLFNTGFKARLHSLSTRDILARILLCHAAASLVCAYQMPDPHSVL